MKRSRPLDSTVILILAKCRSFARSSSVRTQDEPRPLKPEHFEWRHALDAQTYTGVRNLDPAFCRRRNLMRHDDVFPCMSLGDQVVIGNLEKSAHSGRLVVLAFRPCANDCQ